VLDTIPSSFDASTTVEARASPCALLHGRCWTLPAPAVKIIVNASVMAQLGERGSSAIGICRIRRTRSKSDPPVAASAIVALDVRQLSSSASACA
jgi:hypothetical protein